ncbi:MAG: type III-B CRISPR module RAMP protein Cmr4 [Ktedonobacteraceae bacterium]
MITAKTMLYLYVETPLHAGVGSGLSSIDLPIQRERTTQYPMIQGSGIKGKLRAIAEDVLDDTTVNVLFGSPTTGASDYAGALVVGDARLLLFPVRALNGVFAYTTSYDVLNRFQRDIGRETPSNAPTWKASLLSPGKALVTTNSHVHMQNKLVLEECSFETQSDPQVDEIAQWLAQSAFPDFGNTYWSERIKRSLVILSNDDFRDFALYATEVITRVRLDRQSKTVVRGALWTEEHLPVDTLLYVPIYATSARQNNGTSMKAENVLAKVKALGAGSNNYLQLGGDETVGRGIVRMRWETQEAGITI